MLQTNVQLLDKQIYFHETLINFSLQNNICFCNRNEELEVWDTKIANAEEELKKAKETQIKFKQQIK